MLGAKRLLLGQRAKADCGRSVSCSVALWIVTSVLAFLLIPAVCLAEELALEKRGTDRAYFTYDGKPLLSFGGLSDFIFYASEDSYDYKLWADWAQEHGINHVRAYPPLSWKHIEKFVTENGGTLENALFPYQEVSPGSRQFDLTRFDAAYWRYFRRKCEYLNSKGIIVHLLMWNGWQLRAADTPGRDQSSVDWNGHFFNPANNVNGFTDHLGGTLKNRFKIYHSVADGLAALAAAQANWFGKLIEVTADLGNVYYDLVHELAEHQGHWGKTQQWIDAMVGAIRDRWSTLRIRRQLIIGMDAGGLQSSQREWIFTRPYFNLLIYGKRHHFDQAVKWRITYRKPYIPQESWDDDGIKYSYIHPEQRVHSRKYMWKFLMAKCQQMDLYMKRRPGFSSQGLPRFPHNYDPRGRNPFEDDAVVLRKFWEGLVDYPNLWFTGKVEAGTDAQRYLLSSPREALLYLCSATGKEGVAFGPQRVKLTDLPLAGRSDYTIDIIDPKANGVKRSYQKSIEAGKIEIDLPPFVDDMAVHIH
ncbi:MAG: hypothetical protein ACE5MK_13070 [Acidobacteriota bacterium]